MNLHVITWLWGDKYPPHYVDRLRNSVARNLTLPHRVLVCTPQKEDEHLTRIPGCFARLRTFDLAWQAENGIKPGDHILCLDLDMVVTGQLDGLVYRAEPFVILQGVNSANPCRFNGSVWMLRAGYRPDVWSDFSLAKAKEIGFYAFPEDQRWMEYMIPDAGAWGPRDGVYGFQKPGWTTGNDLPAGAKLVAFFGKRDPSQFERLSWVRQHWR